MKYPNFDIIGRTADQSTANNQGVGWWWRILMRE